jgi:hypothetical protein
MWVPAHVGNCGKWKGWFWGETSYFGQYGVQYIIGCFYSQSRNREYWTNGRKVGKSLKKEGFRALSFPWSLLEKWRTERKLLTTDSRIISGHCDVRAHLKRICIVDGSIMCVCLEDHKTVNHIIWKCSRFSSKSACLIQRLLLSGVYKDTPIRDLWKALRVWLSFMLMPDTRPQSVDTWTPRWLYGSGSISRMLHR